MLFPLEAVQNQKMIKAPVNDTGKRSLLQKNLRLHPVSNHIHAIAFGCLYDTFCTGSVSGNTAVHTRLLQSDPFFIIAHDHRQAGCATFQHFQLHDDRDLCNPLCQGFFYLLCHSSVSHFEA